MCSTEKDPKQQLRSFLDKKKPTALWTEEGRGLGLIRNKCSGLMQGWCPVIYLCSVLSSPHLSPFSCYQERGYSPLNCLSYWLEERGFEPGPAVDVLPIIDCWTLDSRRKEPEQSYYSISLCSTVYVNTCSTILAKPLITIYFAVF